jgi:glycosyltransferase involved in cell wall biosynthesis
MLSVIVPTYNRLAKLQKTLEGFCAQTLPRVEFEVIVVDDGSTDGTREFMEKFSAPENFKLSYFFLEHGGVGRVRNFGIEKAAGAIILFCGDDTCPDRNLLQIHNERHKKEKGVAVLGLAIWDESEKVTDFMHYLAPAGPQFHYNTIKNKNSAGFEHFYTCNISLSREWLETEKFDERFDCAFDDIELGLRLEKKGLRVVFESQAVVFHAHYYDEENFGLRMERVGRAAVLFFDKYKNERKILWKIKWKYAPFCFFPGVKIFLKLSQILAKSKLLKKINLRYHWFWWICSCYARGMMKESINRET